MALPTELSRIRRKLKAKAAHLRTDGENLLLAELLVLDRAIDEDEDFAVKVLSETARVTKITPGDEEPCSCCGR